MRQIGISQCQTKLIKLPDQTMPIVANRLDLAAFIFSSTQCSHLLKHINRTVVYLANVSKLFSRFVLDKGLMVFNACHR